MHIVITKIVNNKIGSYISFDNLIHAQDYYDSNKSQNPNLVIYNGNYNKNIRIDSNLNITVGNSTEAIDELKKQIEEIEIKQLMPRGAREAFIALCLQQGQAAGLTTTQLYSVNPFYRGLKDTDVLCTQLREQIRLLS